MSAAAHGAAVYVSSVPGPAVRVAHGCKPSLAECAADMPLIYGLGLICRRPTAPPSPSPVRPGGLWNRGCNVADSSTLPINSPVVSGSFVSTVRQQRESSSALSLLVQADRSFDCWFLHTALDSDCARRGFADPTHKLVRALVAGALAPTAGSSRPRSTAFPRPLSKPGPRTLPGWFHGWVACEPS